MVDGYCVHSSRAATAGRMPAMSLGIGGAIEVIPRGCVRAPVRRILIPTRVLERVVGARRAIHAGLATAVRILEEVKLLFSISSLSAVNGIERLRVKDPTLSTLRSSGSEVPSTSVDGAMDTSQWPRGFTVLFPICCTRQPCENLLPVEASPSNFYCVVNRG